MKKSRRLLSVLLALVLVFSVCAVAYATYPQTSTGTVTVLFTHDCSYSDDLGHTWMGYDPDENTLLTGGTANIATLQNCDKSAYLPSTATDPLNGAPSVIDAVLAAQPNYTYNLGWDPSANPGAYIHNVNNQTLDYDYGYDDGIYWASGTGFVIAVQYANSSDVIFYDVYLSNIPLADGMTIYVDLAPYAYTWTD